MRHQYMLDKIKNFNIWSAIDSKLISLDEFYFRARLNTKSGRKQLFYEGWGNQDCLDFVDKMWDCKNDPARLDVHWTNKKSHKTGATIETGIFESTKYFDWLPPESRTVTILHVRPKEVNSDVGVLIAPTSREIGFKRRMKVALDLATSGVQSVLINNPFMGLRKPSHQFETVISKFSDYPLMAAACVEENRMVLQWMREQGMSTLCATGVSQGGFTTIAAALRLPFAVNVVAVVPPNSAEQVVIEGIPGRLCAWDALERTCPPNATAIESMRSVFNRTRLDRIVIPDNGSQIHLVAAKKDHYVPASSYNQLAHHLKNVGKIEWREGGHVSTIMERRVYTEAIKSALVN